jgi:DNA mismatch endonuclease (patch repair protein)
MARTRGKNNPRERALRSALHRRGLRFRVHLAKVPGTKRTIDIAFTRLRVAIFCDGCFWHGCPIHGTAPKTNYEWWMNKIAANRVRDRDTDARLMESGWSVLRVWEHVSLDDAVTQILAHLHRFSGCGFERG